MEDRITVSLLLDFYGALLTKRQRECLVLHHEDDMSLGEIAEELGISRQAVHDNMQRAMQLLEGYENTLHMVAQYTRREAVIAEFRSELAKPILSKDRLSALVAQMEG